MLFDFNLIIILNNNKKNNKTNLRVKKQKRARERQMMLQRHPMMVMMVRMVEWWVFKWPFDGGCDDYFVCFSFSGYNNGCLVLVGVMILIVVKMAVEMRVL